MDTSLLDSIATAGTTNEFAQNLDIGQHLVCLKLVEKRETREYGTKIDVEFVIVESTVHKPGETRGDVFFIQKPGDSGKYSRQRANAFAIEVVRSLGGNPEDPTPVEWQGKTWPRGQALVTKTLGEILAKENPSKGLLLKVSSRARTSKNSQKTHVNNTYEFVPGQTREDMGKRRQAMEAGAPAAAPAALTPAPAPAVAAPAPMLGGLL